MKKRIFAWLLVCCLAFSSCSVDDFGGLVGGDIGGIAGGGSQTETENNGGNSGNENGGNENEGNNGGTVGGGGQGGNQGGNGDSMGGNQDGNGDSTGGNQGGNGDGATGGGGQENDKESCVDDNDDGICDDCKESVIVPLAIVGVNDLHGKVLDGDNHPGVDEMSTYIKQLRAEYPNNILLSSGDMWQGMSASNLTRGRIVTDWMNEMDFDSMTLGNHEYDWGEDIIKENAELAEFPILAINIYDKATNERVDYCQPSVLIDQGNLKVGIIGAMGDCYSSISASNVAGVTFKTGSELTALVKAEAQSLRARGADCIIYSIHDSHDNCDSTLSQYVDVVFEGHSHKTYTVEDSYGVYHLQGGGDNSGISVAGLYVNVARNESETADAGVILSSSYAEYDPDPVVAMLQAKYADEIAKAGEVLGWNDTVRQSNEISTLVAKLYYELGVKHWGGQYEIALGGGSLNLRSPYKILAGEVAYEDLQNVLPFDNQIELCKVTGATLKSRFINNSDYYIYKNTALTSNIVDTKEYYIVLDTWSSRYSVNKTTVIDTYDETTFARDLLADYIRGGGWGTKPETDKITLTSIPDIHALSSSLSSGGETTQSYYVKGKIISITQSYYGNVAIEDENGQRLFVYGISDVNGTKYGNMASAPQVGDTVILYGKVKKYTNDYGTVELYYSTLISVE